MYKVTTYPCSIHRILGMHITYVGYKNLSKIQFGKCVQICTFLFVWKCTILCMISFHHKRVLYMQGGGTTWLLSAEHTWFLAASGLFFPINFSCNEQILMGPGAHSTGFKNTKEEYFWHIQRSVVFYWCSIKILWVA